MDTLRRGCLCSRFPEPMHSRRAADVDITGYICRARFQSNKTLRLNPARDADFPAYRAFFGLLDLRKGRQKHSAH